MKHPAVSVQVVTHNSARTLAACLASVRRQTYGDYVLTVIDNGSADRTLSVARTFGVRIIRMPGNVGYAAAHNAGFRSVKSEYVLTLNPDVVLSPDFLTRLVDAAGRERQTVGSLQACLYRTERMAAHSEIMDSAGLYMTPHRRQLLRFGGKRIRTLKREAIFGPDGAAAFYRRDMLEDIDVGDGIFDRDFFMHKEDVDVCWRAQLRGWQSVFVPDAVAYHIRTFRPGVRTGVDPSLRRIAARNRYFLMTKNEIPSLFFLGLPWILLYEAGMLLYMIVRERSSLGAYAEFLRSLPGLVQKRRRIQRSRRAGAWSMARWFFGRSA